MPELPEVETLRRELTSKIIGKTIKGIEVDTAKLINVPLKVLNQKIKNQKIKSVSRRAKVLIWGLTNGFNLLIHLKLTGQLVFRSTKGKHSVGGHPINNLGELPNKFTHIIFNFTDGSRLFFNDIRKFGWLKLLNQEQLTKELAGYGVEPLSQEFTLIKFKEILKKRPKAKIKQVLLDQKLISGIGNIYADESCFYAKIKPTRIIKTLKEKEIKDLYQGIKKILKFAVNKKGTSSDTYVQLDGSPGGMEKYLKVYGRAGEKCLRCGGVVKKIKLNGRGTSFCEKCQK